MTEIKNGLRLDITDIQDNVFGHERGIEACQYFRDLANGLPVPDSLANGALFALLRDYISIQNQSGYESLKSRGLELISNDSLRLAIIHMYEFEHQALSKLEENYTENQFFENYFHPINEVLGPFMTFDSKGKLSGFNQPVFLSDADRNQLLIYLDKIEFNRRFMLQFYARNREKAEKLIRQIEEELE